MYNIGVFFSECEEHYNSFYVQGNIGKGKKLIRISKYANNNCIAVQIQCKYKNVDSCRKIDLP